MGKFVRPALCRLCKCPAGSDGVQLSRLDIVKLSRWWRKALETEFEDEQLEEKFLCQFCLWDAKFQGELKGSDGCDWWTGHDTDELYKKFYYEDALLKPCAVTLPSLKLPQDLQSEPTVGRGVRTKCVYCAAAFESIAAAYRHALDSHKDTVKFSCKSCKLFFVTFREKKLHGKMFHRTVKFFCHICKKRVKSRFPLSHISEKHFSNSDCVECCGKSFRDQESLSDHFKLNRMMHNGLSCVYCNKSFKSYDILTCHIKIYHSEVAIKCNYTNCGKFFLSVFEKNRHVAEVHESKPGLVQCVYCKQKISNIYLSRHVLAMHHSQAIRCTFKKCCTYFKTEMQKKEHERQVHFRTKLSFNLNCSQCGKPICNRNQLKKHFRRMHQREPMFCKIYGCREYFLSESELQNHYFEKHAEDEAKKSFKCDECSYASRRKDDLRSHTWSKHRAGSFKCGTCDKMFKGKNTLAHHIATTHTEPKKCIHCGEAQRNLHQHLRVTPCRKCKTVAPCTGLRKAHEKQCKIPSTFSANRIASFNNKQ